MELKKIKLDKLKPASYNPRKISEESYKKLQNSIEKFGIVDPIVINTNTKTILAGHQRFDVLYHNSPKSEVNVLELGDISWVFPDSELKIEDENHEKALNIALNQISGEWDIQLLTPLLDELDEVDLGELTGFNLELEEVEYDLVEIANSKFNSEDDSDEIIEEDIDDNFVEEVIEEEISDAEDVVEISEINESSKSKRFVEYGDVYKIGSDYIMCGDANDESEVKELLSKKVESLDIPMSDDLIEVSSTEISSSFFMTLNPKRLEEIILKFDKSLVTKL